MHDEQDRAIIEQGRRDARWRIAELAFEYEKWGESIVALNTFLEEYPDDQGRFEARFLLGRCLTEIGDGEAAKRQWDIVTKEDPDGLYGKLAKMELKLARWRGQDLKPALERARL